MPTPAAADIVSASSATGTALSVAITTLPSAAYVDQYRRLLTAPAAACLSFDHATCGIILVSNILRVYFWLAVPFETPLLLQSLLLIATQFAVLHLYVPAARRCGKLIARPHGHSHSSDSSASLLTNFWAWPDFSSYLMFCAAMALTLLIVHHTFSLLFSASMLAMYGQLLGAAALSIEAFVPVPQAVRNMRRRSTAGLSPILILSWTGGDLFKSYYFIRNGSPLQFLLCALFQVCVDVLILLQIVAFRNSPPPSAAHDALLPENIENSPGVPPGASGARSALPDALSGSRRTLYPTAVSNDSDSDARRSLI